MGEARIDTTAKVDLLPYIAAKRPLYRIAFEGEQALLAEASRPDSRWGDLRTSRRPDHEQWSGTRSWADACALVERGWREGYRRLEGIIAAQPPLAIERAPGWTWDVAGGFPDVPRHLAGDPECMVDLLPREQHRRPVLRLAASPVCDQSVPMDRIAAWGAALVSRIDALEEAGTRVELTWVSFSSACSRRRDDTLSGPDVLISFVLKGADQPVSIDMLAFWLMHPAAQRRMQFAVKEQHDLREWYGYEYGRAIADERRIGEALGGGFVVLSVGDGAATMAEADQRIAARIAASWDDG